MPGTEAPPPIQALTDVSQSINLLSFTDPGAGKTVLAGTMPNGLIVSFDQDGTISASRMGSKCSIIQPRTWKQFAAFLNEARKPDSDYAKFDWYAIDSVTEMQNLCLHGILIDPPDGKKRDIDTPQIQDYGKWQHQFKRVIRTLNALPQNVLYTAHAMRTEDEDGNAMVLPDINGKNGSNDPTTMSRWVCGTMNAYGYLKVKSDAERKEYRRWIFTRNGAYFGKDRYGVLRPFVDNPTIPKVQALIEAPIK